MIRNTQSRTLALVALLVLSVVAPFAAPAAANSTTEGSPSGMTTVPDANVGSDLPPGTPMGDVADRLEGQVLSGAHSDTLDVVVTNPGRAKKYTDGAVFGGGPVAIVLRDDQNHEGRQVALPRSVLEDVLGYVPKAAYGTHEDGTQWTARTHVDDGYVVFDVPHFSTNTVTFAGEVNVTGSYQDASQVLYNLTDLDSASDPLLNVTGTTNTEYENKSAAGVSLSATHSLSVAGNLLPTDGSGGNPTLSVTGHVPASYSPFSTEGDGASDGAVGLLGDDPYDNPVSSEVLVNPNSDMELEDITLETYAGGSDYGVTVDVYLHQGSINQNAGEGTLIASGWNPDWVTGTQTIPLDTTPTLQANTNYTVEFVSSGTDSDGSGDYLNLYKDSSASSAWYAENYGGSWNSQSQYGNLTLNPVGISSLSVTDGDGESHSFGAFADGETKTANLNLTTSSTELNFSGSGGGSIDYELTLQERTQTVDPAVEVNGHWENVTGSLSDGSTVSRTLNSTWLVEGTNKLNVSVGDGTLSADAPAPTVAVEYTHDAGSQKTVDYTAERWSERYNVSHTYASDREASNLTIPFAGEVVQIRDLETRTNGGSWSDVSAGSYTLDGTTLTVDLGSVSADTTVEVRANGSKVDPVNMTIDVLEPSSPGERLDTRVSVGSTGTNPHIELGSQRITYTYNETWTADEEAVFDTQGQTLTLPNTGAGAEFRVSTIPVSVSPETGDVAVSVSDPQTSEPVFHVAPGSSTGDSVTYTLENAKDDTKYALLSKTDSVVRDSGTANSPLPLVDDDSDETLQFILDDSASTTDDPPPQDPRTGPIDVNTSGLPVSGATLLIGGLLVGLVAFVVVRRQYGATPTAGGSGADTGLVGSALAWTGYGVQSSTGYLRSNPYAAAGLAVAGIIALFAMGVFTLGRQLQFYLAVIGVLLATYLVLTRTGQFTLQRFGLFAAVATILALEYLNPGSISDALGSGISGAFPVLIVASIVGYYLYSKRQKAKEEAQTPDLVFKGGRR